MNKSGNVHENVQKVGQAPNFLKTFRGHQELFRDVMPELYPSKYLRVRPGESR